MLRVHGANGRFSLRDSAQSTRVLWGDVLRLDIHLVPWPTSNGETSATKPMIGRFGIIHSDPAIQDSLEFKFR